ncbi:Uncharacterised protein [Mycobacteroides abscessus subsp. abscessus]|nr:Uncharacterised protein [Mycobacteroides abscessus subsp. abscessus]
MAAAGLVEKSMMIWTMVPTGSVISPLSARYMPRKCWEFFSNISMGSFGSGTMGGGFVASWAAVRAAAPLSGDSTGGAGEVGGAAETEDSETA